jgi:outer membrane protein assembly factor BamB
MNKSFNFFKIFIKKLNFYKAIKINNSTDKNRYMSKKILIPILTILISCSSLKLERNLIPSKFDWVQYGNSPTRSNITHYEITPPFQLAWKYNAGAGFSHGPMLVADGILFIGTLGEEIHLVDIETGKKIGVIKTESAVSGTPVLYKNKLIIPNAHGKNTLQSIDLNLGKILWKEKIGAIEASLLLVGNNLIVTTLEGLVINYKINYDIAEKIWEFKTPKPIRSSPASDGEFIVFGCDDGNLYCIDFKSGALVWKFNAGSAIFAPISISNGKVFFGSINGIFYALNLKNGKLEWKFNSNSKIYGGCSIKDSLVFFGTASGKFFALNKETGEIVWEFLAKSIINSAPIVSNETVFFGSLDKNVYAIDIATGNLLWSYETRGRIKSSPIIWRNFLFVASEDNLIYAFKTQTTK